MESSTTPAHLIDELFAPDGLLAQSLPSYEQREDQRAMAVKLWESFESDQVTLFEAGTGIGKSLAYLIPALLWSYKTGEKVVISTYTISLQEQLLEKDIPLLIDALGLDLRIALAKGMGNYACLRKIDELAKMPLFSDEEEQASQLITWVGTTKDGTRSSLPFSPKGEVWSKACAESENCSYVKCPHYQQCFFFKARSDLAQADVIIANHHLLLAHLRADEKGAILPPFSRLIIDEAHHLAPVACSSLTKVLDRVHIFRAMGRIHSDSNPEVSRLLFLRDVLSPLANKSLINRLGLDLPAEKRTLTEKVTKSFDLLDQHYLGGRENRIRIDEGELKKPIWKNDIIPAFEEMREHISRYCASLGGIESEVQALRFDGDKGAIENALADIANVVEKMQEIAGHIADFFSADQGDAVRWAEKIHSGIALNRALLDISAFLDECLFTPVKSACLCSATLAVEDNFSHLKKQVGLKERETVEKIYPSPFDYANRTKLLGVEDIPQPSDFAFISSVGRILIDAIDASKGGVFVLFTSYHMLNKCALEIDKKCVEKGYPLFCQGDMPRHQMIEEFKACGNGVLLGTDSFWEGVDVAGDALRLVVITKLPFPVPSDPILQARGEKIAAEGGNPFGEESVPLAVMKFKQGFGRLMRRSTDRGCVLCLDQRLFSRSYGKRFLRSLPECITTYGSRERVITEMKTFYKNGA